VGNGPRIVEPGVLTVEMIEEAAEKALANFGRPSNPIIFMPPGFFMPSWEQHPEYRGTPWAMADRLTKNQHTVAKVHTILKKLGVLKNISEEEFQDIRNKTVKQLKLAKWAKMPVKRK
jgi:hypothetical protein